jgi:hypothetical protein
MTPLHPSSGAACDQTFASSLVGIWQWRRWAASLVGMISDLYLGIPVAALLVRLGLLAGLAGAIRQQWESFR